jgi:hypothetical protein
MDRNGSRRSQHRHRRSPLTSWAVGLDSRVRPGPSRPPALSSPSRPRKIATWRLRLASRQNSSGCVPSRCARWRERLTTPCRRQCANSRSVGRTSRYRQVRRSRAPIRIRRRSIGSGSSQTGTRCRFTARQEPRTCRHRCWSAPGSCTGWSQNLRLIRRCRDGPPTRETHSSDAANVAAGGPGARRRLPVRPGIQLAAI